MGFISTPTVFIGIGGTGTRIVTSLENKLRESLHKDDFNLVRFMGLDTRSQDFGVNLLPINFVACSEAHGSNTGADIVNTLLRNNDQEFADWFKNSWHDGPNSPELPNLSFEAGAGGVRRYGRLLLDSYTTLVGGAPLVNNINGWLNNLTGRFTSAQAILFCSLSGGSASGMAMELAMALKHFCTETIHLTKVTGVVVLPEVFAGEALTNEKIDKDLTARNFRYAMEEIRFFEKRKTWTKRWPVEGEIEVNARPFDALLLLGSKEVGQTGIYNYQKIDSAEGLAYEFFKMQFTTDQGLRFASAWINRAAEAADNLAGELNPVNPYRMTLRKVGFSPTQLARFASLKVEELALRAMLDRPQHSDDIDSEIGMVKSKVEELLKTLNSSSLKLSGRLTKIGKEEWFEAAIYEMRTFIREDDLEDKGDLKAIIERELNTAIPSLESRLEKQLDEAEVIYETAFLTFCETLKQKYLITSSEAESFAKLKEILMTVKTFVNQAKPSVTKEIKSLEALRAESREKILKKSDALDDQAFKRKGLGIFLDKDERDLAISEASKMLKLYLRNTLVLEQREADQQILFGIDNQLKSRLDALEAIEVQLKERLEENRRAQKTAFVQYGGGEIPLYKVNLIETELDANRLFSKHLSPNELKPKVSDYYKKLVSGEGAEVNAQGRPINPLGRLYSNLSSKFDADNQASHRGAGSVTLSAEAVAMSVEKDLCSVFERVSVLDLLWEEAQTEGGSGPSIKKFQRYLGKLMRDVRPLGALAAGHTSKSEWPHGGLFINLSSVSGRLKSAIPGKDVKTKDQWIVDSLSSNQGRLNVIPSSEAWSFSVLVIGEYPLESFADYSEVSVSYKVPRHFVDARYAKWIQSADQALPKKQTTMILLAEWFGILGTLSKGKKLAMIERKTCGSVYILPDNSKVSGKVFEARDKCFTKLRNSPVLYQELLGDLVNKLKEEKINLELIDGLLGNVIDVLRRWKAPKVSKSEELRELLTSQEQTVLSVLNDKDKLVQNELLDKVIGR